MCREMLIMQEIDGVKWSPRGWAFEGTFVLQLFLVRLNNFYISALA